jgi:hypothetical protein
MSGAPTAAPISDPSTRLHPRGRPELGTIHHLRLARYEPSPGSAAGRLALLVEISSSRLGGRTRCVAGGSMQPLSKLAAKEGGIS